jgi:hypothetical protein
MTTAYVIATASRATVLVVLVVLFYTWLRWGRPAYLRAFRPATGLAAAGALAAGAVDLAAGASPTLLAVDITLLLLTSFAAVVGPYRGENGASRPNSA